MIYTMDHEHSIDDHTAASVVAALASTKNGKRSRDDDNGDGDVGCSSSQSHHSSKVARLENMAMAPAAGPEKPPATDGDEQEKTLKPFPYFYYRDWSTVVDSDPLTPLTTPGRVPNFPAKMHSILSRTDLADVVAWMPHGRAWRVLKPREFEIRVIPTYFEHAKFSSFIRQANGWGFRRVTQGRDRNAYYHEMFLRGLPHLCKMMKRPGVSEKEAANPDHEPDFYKITEEHPVPEEADDESILLQCTLQGGPKARMPIYLGGRMAENPPPPVPIPQTYPRIENCVVPQQQSGVVVNHQYHQHSNGGVNQYQPPVSVTPDSQYGSIALPPQHSNTGTSQQQQNLPPHFAPNRPPNMNMELGTSMSMSPSMNPNVVNNMNMPPTVNMNSSMNSMTSHSVVSLPVQPVPPQHHMAAQQQPNGENSMMQQVPNQVNMPQHMAAAGAYQNSQPCSSTAASQFAAGFAAATALSHQQFRSILGQALSSFSSQAAAQQQQQQQGAPQQPQAPLPPPMQPAHTMQTQPVIQHQYYQPQHQLQTSCEPQMQQLQQP